jgi:myotubularin-related protein 1/2
VLSPGSPWRATELNRAFELCPTYPALLVVPKALEDDVVQEVRAPALRARALRAAAPTRESRSTARQRALQSNEANEANALWQVVKFRSKQRLPVLSWWDPATKAAITRCAQPLVGTMGNSTLCSLIVYSFLLVVWGA